MALPYDRVVTKWLGYLSTGETDILLADVKLALLDDPKNELAWHALVKFMHYYKKESDDASSTGGAYVLYEIAALCCQSINTQQYLSVDKIKYIGAMYHIIENLLKKEMIVKALKLLPLLVVTCDTEEQNDERSKYVYSIYGLYIKVYFTVMRRYKDQPSSELYLLMLDIVRGSTELLTSTDPRYLDVLLINVTTICLPESDTKHFDTCISKLLEIHLNALSIPAAFGRSKCDSLKTDNSYCNYISLVSKTIGNCLQLDDFATARIVIAKLENACELSIFSSSVPLEKYLTFVKQVLSAVLYPVNSENKRLKYHLDLSYNTLKTIEKLHSENTSSMKSLSDTCTLVIRVLQLIQNKWQNCTECEWNRVMNVDVLTSLHNLVIKLAAVLQKCPCFTCKVAGGGDCKVKVDISAVVQLLLISTSFVKRAIVCKMEHAETLLVHVEIIQQKCILHVLDLKAEVCPSWANVWCTAALASYNMAVVCYQNELWLHAKKLFAELSVMYLTLEDLSESQTKLNFSLWMCFRCMIQSYEKLNKMQGALVGMVVALGVFPEKCDAIFKMWFLLKYHHLAENKELLTSTLWHVYEKNKAKLQVKYPNVTFGAFNPCETLTQELDALNRLGYSMPSSVGEALIAGLKRVLVKRCDSAMHARALRAMLEAVARWSNKFDNMGALEISKRAIDGLRNSPVMQNTDNQCTMSEILYWQYVCQRNVVRLKQMSEIKQAQTIPMTVSELEAAQAGLVASDEVETNIVNINVDNEKTITSMLDDVVSCASVVAASVSDKATTSRLINVLSKTALAYELYGYDVSALRTWTLVNNLACIVEDQLACIQATSHLMSYIEYDATSSWIQSTNEVASSLRGCADPATQDLIVTYWLNASCSCLHAGKYEEGKALLRKALEALGESSKDKRHLVNAHARLVTSYYLYLPPATLDTRDLGDESAFDAAVEAHVLIYAVVKSTCNSTNNTLAMILLLSATLWLSNLCLRQTWIKQSKRVIKHVFELVQALPLSTRAAQLLAILARGDLLCWALDDCRVKINELINILQIYKASSVVFPVKDVNRVDETKDLLKEMCFTLPLPKMLDCHAADVSPMGSPIAPDERFQCPDFVTHTNTCLCVYCNNVIIQSLALDLPYFQAQCYFLQLNSKQATHYFLSAKELGKRLEGKQVKLFRDLVGEISVNAKFDRSVRCSKALQAPLSQSQANGLLRHADFYACCNKLAESNQLNESLRMLVRSFVHEEHHLIQEIIEQRSNSEFLKYSAEETLNKKYNMVTVSTQDHKIGVHDASSAQKVKVASTPCVPKNKNVRPRLIDDLDNFSMDGGFYNPKPALHGFKQPLLDEDSPLNKSRPLVKSNLSSNKNKIDFNKVTTVCRKKQTQTLKVGSQTLKQAKPKFKIFDEESDSQQNPSDSKVHGAKPSHTMTGKRQLKDSLAINSPIACRTPAQDKRGLGTGEHVESKLKSEKQATDAKKETVAKKVKKIPGTKQTSGTTSGRRRLLASSPDFIDSSIEILTPSVTKTRQFRPNAEDVVSTPSDKTKQKLTSAKKPVTTKIVRSQKNIESTTSSSNSDDIFKRKKCTANTKKTYTKISCLEFDEVFSEDGFTEEKNVKTLTVISPIQKKNTSSGSKNVVDECVNGAANVTKEQATLATETAVKTTEKAAKTTATRRRKILSSSSPDIAVLAVIPSARSMRPCRQGALKAGDSNGNAAAGGDNEENHAPNKQSTKSKTVTRRQKLFESSSSNSDSDEVVKPKKSAAIPTRLKALKGNKIVPTVECTEVTEAPITKTSVAPRSSRRQNAIAPIVVDDLVVVKSVAKSKRVPALRSKKPMKNPFVL